MMLLLAGVITAVAHLLQLLIVEAAEPTFTLPHRGCYYASWSNYRSGKARYLPRHIDASLCTIIYFAFGDIHLDTSGGSGMAPAGASPQFGFLTKTGASPYYNASLSVVDMASDLKYVKRKYPNIKLILSIGGWGAVNSLNAIASSSDLRKLFIASSIATTRRAEYDGIDLSWEYPAKKDLSFATSLFTEFRDAIDDEAKKSGKSRLIFTVAVTNTSIGGYDVNRMISVFDLINIMAYDLHNPEMESSVTGHDSQLYAPFANISSTNVKDVVEGWEKAGAPKSKILVGLAAYGDTWNLTNPQKFTIGAPAQGYGPPGFYTKTKGILAYYEICEKIRSGELVTTLQPDIQTPYAHSSDGKWWISYEDENSIRTKVKWVIGKGYGGVFMWDLTFDDFFGNCGAKYPLLNAVKSEYKV